MNVLNYKELKKEYFRMQYEERLRTKRNKIGSREESEEGISTDEQSRKTRKQEYWEYLIKNS